MPEGKEKEKKIGILSENIVKENFPNNMEVQEVHRILIMTDAKRPTPKHIIIKMPKVKDKERFLKAREENLVTGR